MRSAVISGTSKEDYTRYRYQKSRRFFKRGTGAWFDYSEKRVNFKYSSGYIFGFSLREDFCMELLFDGNGRLLMEACLLSGIFLSFFYGHKKGEQVSFDAKEKINNLENQINNLTSANNKYVSFVIKLSDAAKFLSSNHSFEEAVSSVTRLVEDVLPADCIGLYMYNRATESLKLSSGFRGETNGSKKTYLIGEGMVGAAAKNKALLSKETYRNSGANDTDCYPEMVAPILFKDELLGVIGIGGIKKPHADDKRLLSIVASIAGVALKNAVFIDDARKEAITDPLTKLYNRRFFFQKASEELVRARGYSFPLSFFIFDIDHFKHYNDSNGHPEGDKLLASMASLVSDITRKVSILARYGGEEFIVLLPNIDKETAFTYAERVRRLIEDNHFPHKEKQPLGVISISGGISEFPTDGDTLEKLIELADTALYRSKEDGRNRITKSEPIHNS